MQESPELTAPARVLVAGTVLALMWAEAARHPFRETGGVLFGYRTHEDLVVASAAGPGPRARHGWRSFEPDTCFFQERLTQIYEESEGRISYVGDWHTHPHGDVKPSQLDLAAMLGLADSGDERLRNPLLWIYRPANHFLGWKWTDAHGLWLLDPEVRRFLRAYPISLDGGYPI